MKNICEELEQWLRREAAARIKAANSRREYARNGVSLTDEDRNAAHAIAEHALGRKIPKTTRAEEEKAASVQEKIAAKLEQESAMILGFADYVASNVNQQARTE
jgi:hypothetical protein